MAHQRHDLPSWVSVRSAAVALARTGDTEPLSNFVQSGLADDEQEAANLNYWAYWMGEVPDLQTEDAFMQERSLSWDGSQVLEHLLSRLQPSAGQAELNVHTLSQLLIARPQVFYRRPDLKVLAIARVAESLEEGDLPQRARQELSNIAYAMRLSDR
jgi:hypothetical protein